MKLAVKDIKGQHQGELEVKFALIENGKGTQAVHDAVVAYLANQRMGTACTKNVGEKVSKSTKQLALRKALSERLKSGDVVVVDELILDSPKTKAFVGVLNA